MEDCLESSRLARNKGPDALCAAMAKVAVDRSGGSLEMFAGKDFVTDELLKYVADRAPVLKSIRIISCEGISDIGLAQAIVGKSSLLEELHISHCIRVGVNGYTLDAIGKA
ncbi:hypothetical protein PVAP13_6KG090700 [Panicum virgatum]|uniref:Uncharacterized protein n=1 Tax=Panicum virgatum TaxID=38727 RepID=A0A8T0R8Q6_PANVG|nr:hypothetical protein PVAP13_6KG090700 [Panicum virgatum]